MKNKVITKRKCIKISDKDIRLYGEDADAKEKRETKELKKKTSTCC